MKQLLLITTAIGLMLGTGAFAQSPTEQSKNKSPPAAQNQTNPPQAAPSAQNNQSMPSDKSPTTTGQSAPNTAGGNDSTRSQAQSNQASPPSQGRSDSSNNTAPAAPSQAQSNQPSSSSNQPSSSSNQAAQPSNSPSQAQTNTAPPSNTQTQTGTQTGAAGTQPSGNTAAQPSNNQTNTAQSPSSNVNVSANLNESQRVRVTESISKLNVAPINNVNFSLSVGTVVPRDVRFQPLPAEVVEVMPQYRGYSFFVVRDDIVIVEPSSYQIVDVLPRAGRSTAAAPASQSTATASSSRKTTFSDKDRDVIRKHARSSRTEHSRTEQRATTGSSTTSTRVRVGDRLPDSVEFRSFPDEVYRESPALREYRYIERDNRTYVVEPRERTIIEEIE
jgi:hypothetical protein